MLRARRGLRTFAILGGALGVAAAGVIMAYARGPNEAPAAPQREVRAQAEPPPGVLTAPSGLRAEPAPPAPKAASGEAPRPVPQAPRAGRPVARARRPAISHQLGPRAAADPLGPLPPFLPTLDGPGSGLQRPAPPPPAVLRLTGVVGGEQKLALLRRGESRYLVRVGDTVESGYRVAKITDAAVVLQKGRRTRTLRLGGP